MREAVFNTLQGCADLVLLTARVAVGIIRVGRQGCARGLGLSATAARDW